MKRLSAGDLKDLNLLKHYRIIRKWACKNNGLTDADLELLIYLDCIDMFTINSLLFSILIKILTKICLSRDR